MHNTANIQTDLQLGYSLVVKYTFRCNFNAYMKLYTCNDVTLGPEFCGNTNFAII